MSIQEFRDDDSGYLDWRAKNPHGYVLNILRNRSPVDAHLHDVSCSALFAPIGAGLKLTEQYVKVCTNSLVEIRQWTADHVGEQVPDCGTCRAPGAEIDRRAGRTCSKCRIYELSVSGKCLSCDDV